MRILLASYWSYPSTGAIEIYLRLVSSKLRQAGHQVDILARNGWDELRLLDNGGKVDLRTIWPLIIPGFRDHFTHFAYHPSNWVLSREEDQYVYEVGALQLGRFGEYDLIHAQDVYSSRALARLVPQVPLVTSAHGLAAYEWLVEGRVAGGESLEWRYVFLREKLGLECADRVIVPGNWMKREYVEHFGLSPENIVVLPHGIDVADFDRRAGLGGGAVGLPDLSGRPVVTCIARLVPLKGHRYLLEAMAELHRSIPEAVCLIVGDGPLELSLKQAVSAMGLDTVVHFLGRRDDVPAILARTDVLAVPSLQEVTPLAIMEAQLAAKAVVATDVGGIPDMLDQMDTGVMVPPADGSSMARALEQVLRDSGLRRRLGARGRERVLRERTWEEHLTVLWAVYETARRRRNAGR